MEKNKCNAPLTFHVLHKSHKEGVGQPKVVWVAMAFTNVHPNISMHILHTVLNIFSCSTDMENLFYNKRASLAGDHFCYSHDLNA